MPLEFIAHLGATFVANLLPDTLLGIGQELLNAIVGLFADPAGFADQEKAIAMRRGRGQVGAQFVELLKLILQDRGDQFFLGRREAQAGVLAGMEVEIGLVGGIHGVTGGGVTLF